MSKYERNFKALELRSNAIENAVNVLNTAIGLTIAEIEKQDGKTLSRRITNKVQELINTAFCDDRKVLVSMSYDSDSWNEISFYLPEDRSYQIGEGFGQYTEYVDSELYSRIRFPKADKVDAKEICENARKAINANAKVRYKYMDAVRDYQRTISKYFALLRNFQKECGELNPLLIDSQVYTTCRDFHQWEDERDKNLELA